MLFSLLLSVIFVGLLILKAKKAKTISPLYIVLLSWMFIFSIYLWGDLGLLALSDKLLLLFLLWIVFFILGCAAVKFVPIKKQLNIQAYDDNLFDLLYKLCVCIIPLLLYKIYVIGTGGPSAFFFNLRVSGAGLISDVESIGLLKYFTPIALILYLSELYSYNGELKKKRRIVVLLLINFLFTISTMAKTNIFFLLIPTLIILVFKRKIKKSSFFFIGLLLLILLIVIHFSRGNNYDGNVGEMISNLFKIYVFAGLPAMDQIIEEGTRSGLWGEYIFSSLYKLLNLLGFDFEFGTGQPFIGTGYGYAAVPYPYLTNVFTVLFPFYVDFGMQGVVFFAFLTGFLTATVYKLAKYNRIWAIVVYAHLATSLCLQFFSDFIFSMLSQTIQLFLWAYLLYNFHLKRRFVFVRKDRLNFLMLRTKNNE